MADGTSSKRKGCNKGRREGILVMLVMAFLDDWYLYTAAFAIAAASPLVAFVPGSLSFFIAQSSIWCASTYCVFIARGRTWERAALPCGPHWIQPWVDAAPYSCYEAAFLVQLLNVPAALVMASQILTSREVFTAAMTRYRSEYDANQMWFDDILFGQLFGYMIRDMIMQGPGGDPKLAAHHVLVCILMLGFAFGDVPGIRLLTLTLAIVEIGTSAYCAFVLYKWRRSYIWLQHWSNAFMFFGTSAIVYYADSRTPLVWFLFVIGVLLAIGRTAAIPAELKKEKDRVAKLAPSADWGKTQ